MMRQEASAPVLPGPHLRTGEKGYLLLGVLVLVVLITLSLAIAAPVIATEVRRDKEAEFYHRGLQYARAVRLYYKKFGRYPTSIDQLEDTNKIRFLRKRYVDPMTGQPFRIIHVGEARVQVPGFYGGAPILPNNTSNPASILGGVPGTNPGTTRYGTSGDSSGSSGNPFASSGSPGSPFGSSGNSFGSSGNSFGSAGSPFGSSGNSFGSSGNSFGSSGNSFGSSGSQAGAGTTSGFGSGNSGGLSFGTSNTGTSGSDSNSSGSATAGQTFGGLGIIGVSSKSDHDSIRVYRKQTKYDHWEFVYDASQEVLGATSIGPLQTSQNANNLNNNANTGPGGATQPATPPTTNPVSQTSTQQ